MTTAIVYIKLSTSSPALRLSGSDEEELFYIVTTATIKSSTNPSLPITLHTGHVPVAVTALATVPQGGRTDLASPAPQGQSYQASGRAQWEKGGVGLVSNVVCFAEKLEERQNIYMGSGTGGS